MTTILGISAFYHDSAATLVVDGEIVAAAQEERFTRKKHDSSYPINAIDYCLSEAGLSIEKIDYIVEKNRENYSIIENAFSGIKCGKLRTIPSKCNPLCDTLIVQFDSKSIADEFVARIQDNKLGTKNLPDAIEWHYAKYWDHMLVQIEMSKIDFDKSLEVSTNIIERCVALPIMVKTSKKDLENTALILMKILNEIQKKI